LDLRYYKVSLEIMYLHGIYYSEPVLRVARRNTSDEKYFRSFPLNFLEDKLWKFDKAAELLEVIEKVKL